MKVIDLLLDIANGKEVPAKIKVYDDIYEFDTFNKLYWNEKHINLLESYNGYILTYNVEIIEDTPVFKGFKVKDEEIIYKEDKKIEYIEPSESMLENHINIMKKINEIIDHLNVEK